MPAARCASDVAASSSIRASSTEGARSSHTRPTAVRSTSGSANGERPADRSTRRQTAARSPPCAAIAPGASAHIRRCGNACVPVNGSATRSRNRATAPGSSGASRSSAPSNAVRTSNCSSSSSSSAGAKSGGPPGSAPAPPEGPSRPLPSTGSPHPTVSAGSADARRATTSGSSSAVSTPSSRATRRSCTVRATGCVPAAPPRSSFRISGPSRSATAAPSGPVNASRWGSSTDPLPPRTASVTSIAASGADTDAGQRPSSAPNSRPTASNSAPVRSSTAGEVRASTSRPVRGASSAYGRSAAQPAAADRSSGPSAIPAHSAVTASGPAANGSPGNSLATSNSSGDLLRQTRAAVTAHTSPAPPTAGDGPAHRWTRRPALRAASASSGRTPTTRSVELPGRRVYVVNVSRSAYARGKVAEARPSQRATSAHCRSTSTTGPPPAGSTPLARRRSARTAASQGPRDTAKSSRPSETAAGPGGSDSGSGTGPPSGRPAGARPAARAPRGRGTAPPARRPSPAPPPNAPPAGRRRPARHR